MNPITITINTDEYTIYTHGQARVARDIRAYLDALFGDVEIDISYAKQLMPDTPIYVRYGDYAPLITLDPEFDAEFRDVISTILTDEMSGKLEPLDRIAFDPLDTVDRWVDNACIGQQMRADEATRDVVELSNRAHSVYSRLHALDQSIRATIGLFVDRAELAEILNADTKSIRVVYDIDDEERDARINAIERPFWNEAKHDAKFPDDVRSLLDVMHGEQMRSISTYDTLDRLCVVHERRAMHERWKLQQLRNAQTAIQDALTLPSDEED
jgi:hypothetical protein